MSNLKAVLEFFFTASLLLITLEALCLVATWRLLAGGSSYLWPTVTLAAALAIHSFKVTFKV